MGWLHEPSSVIRELLFILFLLSRVKSDFNEIWYEWYEGKGLQSCRVDFEYLHKLHAN